MKIGLLLLVFLALADKTAEPNLSAPMKFVRLSPRSLPRICPRATHRLWACTRFVDLAFTARCASNGGMWWLDVKARYNAFVFFADGAAVAHEIKHVRDVESDVSTHIGNLEKRTFSTQELCDDAAKAAERDFHRTVREFAQRSQALRD